MQKIFTRWLPAVLLFGATIVSCSDDDTTLSVNYEPPTHSVTVSDLQRTQATFKIESPQAADYAYIIAEKGAEMPQSAEELFKTGTVGQLEDGSAQATTYEIEGSKEYVVYSAVRRINPYVYSEVTTTDLSTDIPYESIVTLDKVGTSDVTYHVQIPENADTVKHILIKEADYIAVKNIIGSLGEINERLYLKVFGNKVGEDVDCTADKFSTNTFGDISSTIHSGTTYLLMAGVVGEDGEIDENKFELIRFDTRTPDVSPYNLDVAVTTSSNKAVVSVIPDPEIVEYRMLVESRAEFDFALAEGVAQMYNLVIGKWNDEENTPKRVFTGAVDYQALALIPNTEYVAGIVGFDAEGREKRMRIDFVTGEPTGPKPTLTITEDEPTVEAPWSTKAFNVKGEHIEEARYGFFIKSQIDQKLHEGSELANVIRANGDGCAPSILAAMQSEEGVTFETDQLQPQTEYMFAVYARNDEYVATVAYEVFRTEEMPKIGGAVRKNMPGDYIASTTDEDGNVVTFPVKIATGIDPTTSATYSDQNRLVCFGFGPKDEFAWTTPTELMAGGMEMEDAYKYYGPKWFIEFKSDTEFVVPGGAASMGGSTPTWYAGYDSDAGKNIIFCGYGEHSSNGRPMIRTGVPFDVEVSDDGNTITVKGYVLSKFITYYPAIGYPSTSPWGDPTIIFECYSDLVLTKQASAASAYTRTAPLVKFRTVSATVGSASIKNDRAAAASRLNN